MLGLRYTRGCLVDAPHLNPSLRSLSIQVSMFMFVTAKVFIEVTTMLMDAKPWMRHFLAELSEAALWSAVAYTFRLAHPDVFAVVPPPPPPPTLVCTYADGKTRRWAQGSKRVWNLLPNALIPMPGTAVRRRGHVALRAAHPGDASRFRSVFTHAARAPGHRGGRESVSIRCVPPALCRFTCRAEREA